MIISKGKITIDSAKVQRVLEWPALTKVKQIQLFLRFANFYHKFIKDFAKITKPLTLLTKKNQP